MTRHKTAARGDYACRSFFAPRNDHEMFPMTKMAALYCFQVPKQCVLGTVSHLCKSFVFAKSARSLLFRDKISAQPHTLIPVIYYVYIFRLKLLEESL